MGETAQMSRKWRIFLIILAAGVLPELIALAAQSILPSGPWVQEPLHEIAEASGAAIALGVAFLLILRVRHDPGLPHLLWVVAALLAMGVMDGVHAVVPFGIAWSWLRHGSTLLGGLIAALVWVPFSPGLLRRRNWLIAGGTFAVLAIALGMTWLPHYLPYPWAPEEDYSLSVRAAHAAGGLGFLAAAFFFLRRYLRAGHGEDLVFASQMLLFSSAGLLFGFSHLWHPDWWVWHFARLLAYSIVLISVYNMVVGLFAERQQAQAALERANSLLEQRVAERTARLREKETELESAQRLAHIGSWYWDANTDVTECSAELLRIFGLDPATQRMPNFTEQKGLQYPPEEWERVAAAVRTTLETGAGYQMDVRALRAGAPIWITTRAEVVRNEGGQITGLRGTVQDITERKQAEEAVRKSEERYRYLFDSIDEGFCVIQVLFDPAGKPRDYRFLELNPAFERQGGPPNALGRTMRELAPGMETHWFDIYGKVALTGQSIRFEEASPALGGWFDVYAFRMGEPREHKVAVVFNNITARKTTEEALRRSEARLTQAVRVGRLGTFEHDHRTDALQYSPLMRELMSLGPDEPVTMQGFLNRVVADDREFLIQAIARAHDPAGDGSFSVEYRVQTADQGVKWLSVRSQTFFEGEGAHRQAVRTIGAVLEVTEQKEVQGRLERLVAARTSKLQELVAELEHFSYTITHDMRAPLRAMQGYAEVMADCPGCQQPDTREFLRRIKTAAARMDLLIMDALNYSRAVRQELALAPVDADSLLRGMLDSYPEFQPARAHIRVEGDIPRVMANEAGLTQCFSNLLGNAVKFVQPGQKPEIRVCAERRDRWVRIWVEDKGIGIPKEMLPRIFDMFSRGHRGYEGTGIGLALVRKVTERMGGRVGVESQAGEGSRFWMELQAVPE